MRIAFDATALPRVAGGAANYILKVVDGLRKLDSGNRVFVFAKPEDVNRLGPWPSGTGFEPVLVRLAGRAQRLIWQQTGMPALVRRLGVDLLHSPHYTVPLTLSSAACVVTFHDLIFFLYPEYHTLAKAVFFRRMIRWAARAADHIITDSDATRSDAVRLLNVPPASFTTVHLAADERFRPIRDRVALKTICERYSVGERFLLMVCTLEPRKNLVGAIRALRIIRDHGVNCRLVIAGAKGWKFSPVFDEVSRQGLADWVGFLGYVPDDDLPGLYSACDVFLYPSLYEGFGLPPLEAMACGSAVVASDRSSMPEILGDGGLRCNPESPDDIALKALSILDDVEAGKCWRERALARAAQFSWMKTARLTHEVYDQVIARRQSRARVGMTPPRQ